MGFAAVRNFGVETGDFTLERALRIFPGSFADLLIKPAPG
jgi:hypothetical protein